jgi:general secretion pathway protein A
MDPTLAYTRHFNLIAEPFAAAPDRRFLWFGEKHLEILANLKVGVEQTRGVLLLTGEEGAGKSVLVDKLLEVLAGDFRCAVLREPGIDAGRFLEFLARAFGLEGEIASKGDFLVRFAEFLKASHARGATPLLIVESAERQEDEVLEQIRLLSNIEKDGEKLLTVLLVGTGRLSQRLSAHKHRALLQRLAVRCRIEALTEDETCRYIRHRMIVAGAFLPIFTDGAVRLIHRFAGGLPKLVNLVCEHALMNACLEKRRTIEEDILRRYIKTMRQGLDMERGAGLASLQAEDSAQEAGTPWKGSYFSRMAVVVFTILCLALVAGFLSEVMKNQPRGQAGFESLPPAVGLNFDAESDSLDAQTSAELERVAGYLNRTPNALLTIKGYSGQMAPPAEAYQLSRRNAEKIVIHLSRLGVDPARIMMVGQGPDSASGSRPEPARPGCGGIVDIEYSTRLAR